MISSLKQLFKKGNKNKDLEPLESEFQTLSTNPLMETLLDDFETQIDPTLWSANPGVDWYFDVDGYARIRAYGGSFNNFGYPLQSSASYDLTGSHLTVKVALGPQPIMIACSNSEIDKVFMHVVPTQGIVRCFVNQNDTPNLEAGSFGWAGDNTYLRIRHDATENMFYFGSSSDGITFTDIVPCTVGMDLTNMKATMWLPKASNDLYVYVNQVGLEIPEPPTPETWSIDALMAGSNGQALAPSYSEQANTDQTWNAALMQASPFVMQPATFDFAGAGPTLTWLVPTMAAMPATMRNAVFNYLGTGNPGVYVSYESPIVETDLVTPQIVITMEAL